MDRLTLPGGAGQAEEFPEEQLNRSAQECRKEYKLFGFA